MKSNLYNKAADIAGIATAVVFCLLSASAVVLVLSAAFHLITSGFVCAHSL